MAELLQDLAVTAIVALVSAVLRSAVALSWQSGPGWTQNFLTLDCDQQRVHSISPSYTLEREKWVLPD